MAVNLVSYRFRNGIKIEDGSAHKIWDYVLTTSLYGYYDDRISNSLIYGFLYNWYAASDNSNLAPKGWHVATIGDWTTLINYLGGVSVAGGKLKETGTSHWGSPNTGATNETGFTALPGGNHSYWEPFSFGIGTKATWFGLEEDGIYGMGYAFTIVNNDMKISKTVNQLGKMGYSVRCVKD